MWGMVRSEVGDIGRDRSWVGHLGAVPLSAEEFGYSGPCRDVKGVLNLKATGLGLVARWEGVAEDRDQSGDD